MMLKGWFEWIISGFFIEFFLAFFLHLTQNCLKSIQKRLIFRDNQGGFVTVGDSMGRTQLVLKTVWRFPSRGFESHTLRQFSQKCELKTLEIRLKCRKSGVFSFVPWENSNVNPQGFSVFMGFWERTLFSCKSSIFPAPTRLFQLSQELGFLEISGAFTVFSMIFAAFSLLFQSKWV